MEARARLVATLFILSSIFSSLAPAFAYFGNNYVAKPKTSPVGKPKTSPVGKPKTAPKYEFKDGFDSQFDPFVGDFNTFDESSATYNNAAGNEMAKGKEEGLRVGFYTQTCPQAEKIVYDIVAKHSVNKADLPAGFVRIFFHDCFVSGCDASILLDKTPSGERVEKESPANADSLKGLDIIDEIKDALEKKCPQTVSCSDILALAARDSMVIAGVPNFPMPSGRRDSRTSREADVNEIQLPGPAEPLDNIIATFVKNGLTVEDMVVLTGAHSIGISHCPSFAYRPGEPNAAQEMDHRLMVDVGHICNAANAGAALPFDPVTNYKMDGYFYRTILENKALLESDQKMGVDPKTRGYVRQLGNDEAGWLDKFGRSFAKMGNINVLTGENGEIRQNCRSFN